MPRLSPLLRRAGALAAPAALAAAVATAAGCASAPALEAETLAAVLAQRPNVLLGEVHDNHAQHAVRVQALRRLLAGGARPALAFEQFDRDRQAVLDAARTAEPPAGTTRVDHLIEQAGARGWDWPLYRPYLELALQYDLPIVAANLSRAQAGQVIRDGYASVFDAAARARLGLERLPAEFLAAHARAVDDGHCNLLSPESAARLARAQIARDALLAEAIRPHLNGRGVVLLTGNGHARNDIGVPFFLDAAERARTLTIGLIEEDRGTAPAGAALQRRFDRHFITPAQPRPDPCEPLRRSGQFGPAAR